MSVAAPPKTITFVSKGDNTRLTIETARKVQRDSLRNIVVMPSEGKHVQFEKHFAVIGPDELSDPCDLCSGNGLLVHEGEAQTCAKCDGDGSVTRPASKINGQTLDMPFAALLQWLRKHDNYNTPDEPCCFWEEGAAPDEPRPTLAEQMKALAEASAVQSLDAVGEVRDLEEETHKRVAILQACEAAEATILLLSDDTEPEAEAEDEGQPDESGSDED